MRNRGITLSIMAAIIAVTACGSDDSPTGTAAVVSVSVGAPTGPILVGATTTLTATAKDASGNTVSGAAIAWTSSSDAIATVSSSGVVTGVAPGTATITATSNGKSGTAAVTVNSKIVNFTATLIPGNEPGTLVGNPTGNGTFTATLDTTTGVFTWNAQFTGLTSTVTLGHIHGPFLPGASGSAGALLNFDPAVSAGPAFSGVTFTGLKTATAGSATGSVVLNSAVSFTAAINGDSLKKLLLAGATYANIHTTSNGGGEIRGQISKK
jgi:hypothetical protein